MKKYFTLFFTFLKIGLFTFGGGYAMLALLESELVSKKKWISHDEFMDMVAIAESTPGPIAINSATFIGYKMGGVLGSIMCTLGVVIPSFTIIFCISLFFDKFLSIRWVAAAFRGIQACVVYLIAAAGIKLFKKLQKNFLNIAILIAVFGCMIAFTLFSVRFSSVFYVLIAAAIGVAVYTVGYIRAKNKKEDDQK